MQIGPVRESELDLTPHRLPRLCAAAPADRLPSFASNGLGQEAARGGRPLAPLIGRAARLILLFCLNGQRLKEAAAAGRAQRVGGGGRCCLGNRAALTRLPLAGRSGSVWRLRVTWLLRRRHLFPLQGHGDRQAASTAVHAGAWAVHQPNTGKEKGRDCQARREERVKPHQDWAAPRLRNRGLRGRGRSTAAAPLR